MVTKNPLRKRLPRELRSEFGKYLVIFVLMVLSIGFISGFLVAGESMILAYNESFEKYQIEDGHLIAKKQLSEEQRAQMEALGIRLYPQFFYERDLEGEGKIRIFARRSEVNLECLMEGEFPDAAGEIAVDRMYADNNQLKIGDEIICKGGEERYTICGLVALSDYSTLFENNNDAMFDALLFGIGVVTPESFEGVPAREKSFDYAWKYENPPESERQEKEVSEQLMKDCAKIAKLEDFVPGYLNQAIHFTGEDLGHDRIMMLVLLYMIIVIMAFVIAVTARNTIENEATVIGTLLASGYSRGELLRHYLTLPMLVMAAAALVGNVLGYTWFKEISVFLYYNSYSLPTYVTVWSASAFLLTTVVPLGIMLAVNVLVVSRSLKLSPMRFLRRDLGGRSKKRALRLSPKIPFFSRYRLRVILQNIPNYLILFLGILFADILLLFGLGLPSLLDHYQEHVEDTMIAEYQYFLQAPITAGDEDRKLEQAIQGMAFARAVETDTPGAEKFSAWTLKTLGDQARVENIPIYGIEPESAYVKENFSGGRVLVSKSFAEKYKVQAGDEIRLKESYEDKTYTFAVDGVTDYEGAVAVFMSREKLNEVFDQEKEFFCGYFSNRPVTDIAEEYLGTVIDRSSLTKVSRQLQHSMGEMMDMVNVFAIIIFVILMYLLSKIIIEKNAQSISMTKILGYTQREIRLLYLHSTTLVVILLVWVSIPIVSGVLKLLIYYMLLELMTGWIPIVLKADLFVTAAAMGLASYAVVAVIEMRKIRKIPMDLALKNVE